MRVAPNIKLLVPGEPFGRLTVVEDAPGRDPLFECSCGNTVRKNRSAVRDGRIKSCGCLQVCHATSLGHSRAKQPGYAEAVIHYGTYFRRASKKGIAWNLNFDEFIELAQQPCFYCGQLPGIGNFFKHNGIDRYDSGKGYDAGNAVSCCAVCNRAKSDMPPGQFETWIERLQGDVDRPYRPHGYVAIQRIIDGFGKEISCEDAIRYGWLKRNYCTEQLYHREEDGVYADEFPNLFVDQGRQLLAYAFAFRAPIQNFVCQNFGVGTGTRPAKTTDVALQAPVLLASAQYTGPLDSIDFLSAFVVRAAFTLGLADANGSLITEMGLFSGSNTLIARRVRTVGINKTSDFAPTLTWRLRF